MIFDYKIFLKLRNLLAKMGISLSKHNRVADCPEKVVEVSKVHLDYTVCTFYERLADKKLVLGRPKIKETLVLASRKIKELQNFYI